jgi:chromosome segregation ATPase
MSDNIDLQKKYNDLTERLNKKKLEKAKYETRLETLEKQQSDTLAEIKKLANVETVEEAENKLKAIDNKISIVSAEAEELLDEISS